MSAVGLGDSAIVGTLNADNVASSSYTRQIRFQYNNTNDGQTTASRGLMTFATNAGALTMSLPTPSQTGDVIEILYVAGGNALTIDATGLLYGTANEIQFGTTSGQYVKLVAYLTKWFIAGRDSAIPATANSVAGLPVLAV
jgi:hypothetical protein